MRKLYCACYGLNCVSPVPPIHMVKACLQCDIWKWGLWEIIRFRWGPKGGALMMDLIDSLLRDQRISSLSPLPQAPRTGQGHSKNTAIWNPRTVLSQDTNPAGTLILDFQSPEPWEINSCCLHHPVLEMLLWQPKVMETTEPEAHYSFLRHYKKESPQEFQGLSFLSFPVFSLAGWWAIWGQESCLIPLEYPTIHSTKKPLVKVCWRNIKVKDTTMESKLYHWEQKLRSG